MKFVVSQTIYIKEKKKYKRKTSKKTVTTVATMPLGIATTVRNLNFFFF